MSTIAHRFRFPFAINPLVGRLREEANYDEYIRQLIKQALEAPTPAEFAAFFEFMTRFRRLAVWNARMIPTRCGLSHCPQREPLPSKF